MTASKSSRARNARAQANATRNRSATAAAGSAVAVKTGAVAKTAGSNGRNGSGPAAGPARAVAARNGGLAHRARAQLVQPELTDGAATRSAVPLWLQITTFLLAVAGLGVSIYLTIAHFTESTLAGCSEKAGLVNCTKVTTSAQSYAFGIPVAVLGLVFFIAAVALMSPWAWRSARREVHLVRIASLVVGIGFVLYLLYAELFIIGSICLYCTSVHVITFLLFVLTAFAAAAWGINPRRPAETA